MRVLVRVVDAGLALGGDFGAGAQAPGEGGVAAGVRCQRAHRDRLGVGILRSRARHDAVLEAAEVEHDPGLEDEQVEEPVGGVALGLPPAGGAAALGYREEGLRHAVGQRRGAADRLAGLGDEEERQDDEDER